ncbi:hypothetical protein DVH24_034829 [Malus domestica]|uniref:Uncharacterized protein n=1 Tax=Malus domestica TaxID=3750 RepID=A0A498ICI1_MALDO|nr:hypothetical protein DVH24_034829 [Malus domestica]
MFKKVPLNLCKTLVQIFLQILSISTRDFSPSISQILTNFISYSVCKTGKHIRFSAVSLVGMMNTIDLRVPKSTRKTKERILACLESRS